MPIHLLNKRYRLVAHLGTGGMGVVYQAVDELLGNRLVAVKEMSLDRLNFKDISYATEAFQREALLLANLTHQNLPRIYDHFSQNGHVYLVMDFIAGKTVAELLREAPGHQLSVEEVLFIGEQLCSVLSYLHSWNPPIIFRDMKPANVMMTASREHLYLIDFGIARFFKPGQARDTLAFGTVGYAPPEQYNMQTSERSDVYSLGATLHQLLTGLDPSQSKVSFFFPSIKVYAPRTPPALESIIMQMVQIDPEKRPDSMLAIKQALHRVRQMMLQHAAMPTAQSPKQITILVPDAGRKSNRSIYQKHTDSVQCVTWSPDGTALASCGRDKSVLVWNVATGDVIMAYKHHLSYVYGVAWSPDSTRIASTSLGNVQVWDADTGENRVTYAGHTLWVYAVAWSPDALSLVSCGADGEVHLWDARTGSILCKYQGFPKVVRTVKWAMQTHSTKVVVGCEDALLYGWDTAIESIPILYQGHTAEVSSIAWSPDATKIVSGSRDKTVKIWDAASGKTLYTYQGHTKEVYAVAWSPDGTCIASAGEDKTVKVWEIMSGKTLSIYRGHTKEVYTVAWSPDSSHIASAGEDKNVHVWYAG